MARLVGSIGNCVGWPARRGPAPIGEGICFFGCVWLLTMSKVSLRQVPVGALMSVKRGTTSYVHNRAQCSYLGSS